VTEPSPDAATLPEVDRTPCFKLLDETPAFTLATLDPTVPLEHAVVLRRRRLSLVFLSDPNSQHCRNLQAHPRCSAALYPAVADGVHCAACRCAVGAFALRDGSASRPAALLATLPVRDELAQAVDAAAPYRFQPGWVRRIDNRLGSASNRNGDWMSEPIVRSGCAGEPSYSWRAGRTAAGG